MLSLLGVRVIGVTAERAWRPQGRANPASRKLRRRSWLPIEALVELEGRGGLEQRV